MVLKDKTRDKIIETYHKINYSDFMVVVKQLKNATKDCVSKDDFFTVKGEIGESVLECIIYEFIKINDLNNWYVYHGLIIGNESDFSTELDIILCTPSIIVVFEVKSWNGIKIVTDKGTITIKDKYYFDVWKQNILHVEALFNELQKCVKVKDSCMKTAMFNYSRGIVDDKRENEFKNIFPIYDETNITRFLSWIKKQEIVRWEIKKVNKILDYMQECSKYMELSHLKYVKSIHS